MYCLLCQPSFSSVLWIVFGQLLQLWPVTLYCMVGTFYFFHVTSIWHWLADCCHHRTITVSNKLEILDPMSDLREPNSSALSNDTIEQYLFWTPRNSSFFILSPKWLLLHFSIVGVLVGAFRPAAIRYHTDVWNTLMIVVADNGNVFLFAPSCCHEMNQLLIDCLS